MSSSPTSVLCPEIGWLDVRQVRPEDARSMAKRARQRFGQRALLMLALVLSARVVRADEPADQGALARELFYQGRELLQAKDYERACAKFAESQRLDPGGGTLLNLALCHELTGKTASAWAEFDQALRMARADQRPDREEFAQTHMSALAPRLSRVRVVVAPKARLPGLT